MTAQFYQLTEQPGTVSEPAEQGRGEGLSHQANVILKWLHSNKFISIYFDLIIFLSFTATKMKQTMSMGNFCQKDTAKIHNKVMRVGL